MSINLVYSPGSSEKVKNVLNKISVLFTFIVAIIATLPVNGFWLCTGMFFTVFFGGIIGGKIGCNIGNIICNYAKPKVVAVSGGLSNIIRIKIFWLLIPQLTGLILGWCIGIQILLMIFWRIPIYALGSEISPSEVESPSITKKISQFKENLKFVNDMSKASQKTKVDALLMVGIDAGSVVTVNEALRLGADLNTPRLLLDKHGIPYGNKQKMAPLFAALCGEFSNNEEIALILINHGADVNIRDDFFKGPTPLLYVLRNDMPAMIVPIIQKGANLNVIDADQKTPLHHVMNLGYENIALMMMQRGASLTAKDKWGNTPLDYASSQMKIKVEQFMKGKNHE